MTLRPLARRGVAAAVALAAMLLAAPSPLRPQPRWALGSPKNLRRSDHAAQRHPGVGRGGELRSFTYVIESDWGYRVGVPQTQTSYTWTRDMVPRQDVLVRHVGRRRQGP